MDPKQLKKLSKKTLHRMWLTRHERIKADEKVIEKAERSIKQHEKEESLLHQALHRDCPHCGGKGYTIERDNPYENHKSAYPCQYRMEWLLGVKEPPEDWRRQCRYW